MQIGTKYSGYTDYSYAGSSVDQAAQGASSESYDAGYDQGYDVQLSPEAQQMLEAYASRERSARTP